MVLAYTFKKRKHITVIKVGLGLAGCFPITVLRAFLVHRMFLHRPHNERSAATVTVFCTTRCDSAQRNATVSWFWY